MPLGPGEMLDVLDAAIAEAKAKRLRKRDPAIILRGPVTVLGCTGEYVGADEQGRAYSFTLRQCEVMRDVILAAAREDARAAGIDV